MVIIEGRLRPSLSLEEENTIDYKKLYEQEVLKNSQLEKRLSEVVDDKAKAERKSIDVVNQFEGILLELEQLREEYRNSFLSLMEKNAECEYMRRSLIQIMQEIKKCNPRKIGADIDIH